MIISNLLYWSGFMDVEIFFLEKYVLRKWFLHCWMCQSSICQLIAKMSRRWVMMVQVGVCEREIYIYLTQYKHTVCGSSILMAQCCSHCQEHDDQMEMTPTQVYWSYMLRSMKECKILIIKQIIFWGFLQRIVWMNYKIKVGK